MDRNLHNSLIDDIRETVLNKVYVTSRLHRTRRVSRGTFPMLRRHCSMGRSCTQLENRGVSRCFINLILL